MKILIISGFLGAGKTTFIRELVKHIDARIAILENDYAQTGVDGRLLESSLPSGQANIWELTEGCICCSKKADFAASALTIANTADPEYLIIEPTGIGRLTNIIATLKQIEYERISLLAPVTIVDGRNYGHCLKEYPGIFQDQIEAAHVLVVSKLEHMDIREIENVKEVLSKLNPTAELILQNYSQCHSAWWQGILERIYGGQTCAFPTETMEKLPDTCSLTGISLSCPEELVMFLEDLIRGRLGNIFRAKGYVSVGNEVLRFDLVDGLYAIKGAEDSVNSSGDGVFIGNNIDHIALRYRLCGRGQIEIGGQKNNSRKKIKVRHYRKLR